MSYPFNFPYTFSLLNTPFQLFLTHLFKFLTHLYLTPLLHLFKPPFDHPNYSKFSVTNPHTNFEKFLTLSSSSSSLIFTKTFPFPFQQNPNRNLHHFSSIFCIFFTLFSFFIIFIFLYIYHYFHSRQSHNMRKTRASSSKRPLVE